MTKKACSDEEFQALFQIHGAKETAKILNRDERGVHRRRRRLEETSDNIIHAPTDNWSGSYPERVPFEVTNGVVIIGSDVHVRPGIESTAQRAFKKINAELQPAITCLNGDVLDFPRISKHSQIGWEKHPKVNEEKEAVDEWVTDVEDASKNAKHLWTLGNHDMRFENMLANKVGEFEGTNGFMLKEHFPAWTFVVSFWINNHTVVKHRWKGGIHATHNNVVNSGKSMVTGHLHALKVTPFDDYNGTRYGVDTGTMANTVGALGPQFKYIEDNPTNWRSGFIVLTFYKGRLLCPEIVSVLDEKSVSFRGVVITV
jgi:hypothetical protein